MKKKNKILFISPSFYSNYGGAENQVSKIIEAHKKSNYVSLFDIEVKGRNPKKSYSTIKNLIFINAFKKLADNFYLLKITLDILKKKYSIIHSHNFDSPALMLAFLSHFIKIPMLVKLTLYGRDSKIDKITKSKIKSFFFKYLYGNIYFHIVTPELSTDLENLGINREQIILLPNGVKINPNKKKKLNTIEKKKYCFTGRLIQRKCILELAKIFNNAKLINSILSIYGDGPEYIKLDNYIRKNNITNITLKGSYQFSEDKIIDICRNNDLYISYSYSEGMSNSSMEAIANGLLTVLRKISPNEFIMPNNNKFLVGDLSSLDLLLKEIDQMSINQINKFSNEQRIHLSKFDIIKTSNKIFENYLRLMRS